MVAEIDPQERLRHAVHRPRLRAPRRDPAVHIHAERMDWTAFTLSLQLGAATLAILLPVSVALGRTLAFRPLRGHRIAEALVALAPRAAADRARLLSARRLRQPIAIRPAVRRAHRPVARLQLRGARAGLGAGQPPVCRAADPARVRSDPARRARSGRLLRHDLVAGADRIELPLAWPGIVTAAILTFAHTLGEFGVVLMVGGNIPGETRTLSIAIYDRMQAFDDRGAGNHGGDAAGDGGDRAGVTNVLARRSAA